MKFICLKLVEENAYAYEIITNDGLIFSLLWWQRVDDLPKQEKHYGNHDLHM